MRRERREAAAAVACVVAPLVVLLAGCGYPEYAFVGANGDASVVDADASDAAGASDAFDSALATDAADTGADAQDGDAASLPTGSCPAIVLGQDLASTVSQLPISTPIEIDGDGGEWCSLRAFELDATACNWLEPDPLPSWAAGASARVRLAWEAGADASASSLYLDAVVADATSIVAPAGGAADQGASFTLYVGAVKPLTGAYDDVADQGATAFVFAPPQAGIAARASVDVRGAPAHALPSGAEWVARRIVGGYEIEARLPWSAIAKGGAAAPVPALGATIGLDLVLRVRDATGTLVRLIWHAGGVSTTSCPADPLPECDDRTWHTPQLGL